MNINRYTFKIIPLLAILLLLFVSCGGNSSDSLVTDTDSEAIFDSLGISRSDSDNETSGASQDFFNNTQSEKIKPQGYDDADNSESSDTEKGEIETKTEPETVTESEAKTEPETVTESEAKTETETITETEIKTETETKPPVVPVVTDDKKDSDGEGLTSTEGVRYILNIKSKKFHYPSCRGVSTMNEANKKSFNGTREEAISQGYSSCGICEP